MSATLKPIHPGFILQEDFMKPLGISQNRLGVAIGVDVWRINSIVHGKRAITPDTALCLGVYFTTGPKVWLKLQQEYDPWLAERNIQAILIRLSLVFADWFSSIIIIALIIDWLSRELQ